MLLLLITDALYIASACSRRGILSAR